MSKRTAVTSEILQGLEEVLAFEQGMISLNTREVEIVPEPPRSYQASEVKELRERLGYSQAFFARVIGVSTDAVRSWEQGHRSPSRSAARVLELLDDPSLLKKFTSISRKSRSASA